MRGLKEQSTENVSFEYQILLSVGLKCGSIKTAAQHWMAAVVSLDSQQ